MLKKIKFFMLAVVFVLTFFAFIGTNVTAQEIFPGDVYSVEDFLRIFEGKDISISGNIVTLNEDIILEEGLVTICEGEYALDLNGNTLQVSEFYVVGGKLTVNDSKGNGKLNTTSPWFEVLDGTKLTINGGKINYLTNGGTTVVNNGTVENLTNDGTITINEGNITYFWQRGKTATIKGGTFGPSTIDLDRGTTTISGSVEFKRVDGYQAITVLKSSSIDTSVISQILGEGYISAINEYGSNSYPDELRETGWCYEVTYGPTFILKDETEVIFNKIAPNGIWKITGSKPKDMHESEFMLTAMVGDVKLPKDYEARAWVEPADEFNPESVTIFILYKDMLIKEKTVKAVYNEPGKEIKTKVNSVLDKIADKTGDNLTEENGFRLEDLYLINYLNATTKGIDGSQALNFSKDLIALTNGGNISYKYDSRLGAFTPTELWGFTGGQVIVYYDGIAVGTTKIGLTTNNVLYVPTGTANTDEARIAAALKRIEDYLGTTDGITISKGETLESLNAEGFTWKDYGFIDETTSGSNYYNITINDETYKFAICMKDADKLETPEYLASDIMSNIAIKSTSTKVPLDTAISVETVKDDKIKKALGTDTYAAYDITLYSATIDDEITKLEDGKFIVNIPVPESLKNIKSEDLTVYYVNEKGERKEHTATVNKDGIASFETDHFSTYVLAERVDGVNNPNTSDNVLIAVATLMLSMVGVFVAIKCIKK